LVHSCITWLVIQPQLPTIFTFNRTDLYHGRTHPLFSCTDLKLNNIPQPPIPSGTNSHTSA
jgi:hypothetical protein